MPPYGVRVSPVWRATGGRPKGLLSDVDAKRQQELPRKRVREHARQRTFCKAEKFIRLSYSRFGGGYPKTNAAFLVARSPPAAHAPPPSRRGGLLPTVDKIKFLAGGRGDPSPTGLAFAGTAGKVRIRNVRTNPVGGWRTTPQAHDAPQVSLQCSHKPKGSPPVKGAGATAPEGL